MLLGKRTGQSRILALFAVLTLLLVTLLGSFPLGLKAESNVHQWSGSAGDNNWDTGGNWDTGVVPGAGHTAVIPTGKTVNIASGTVNVCLQNQGNLTVLSGAAIELANGSQLIAGGISGDGTVSIETGSTTWSGGTFDGNGFVLIQPNGTLQATGGDKVMSRQVSNRGVVSVDVDHSKKLTFTKNYSDFNFATIKILGGRIVEFSGPANFEVNGAVQDLGTASFRAQNGANVTFNGSYNVRNTYVNSATTVTWAALADSVRQLGLVSVSGGMATFNGETSCQLNLSGKGIVNGTGNITLSGQSDWSGGDIKGSGNLIVPSVATLTLRGNSYKSSTRNLALSGTLRCEIGPYYSNPYVAATTSGSVTLNEGSSLHVELLGGYVPPDSTNLTIISCATPLSGKFSTVTSNNSALTLSYQYTPPYIVAVVRHNDTTPPKITGHSPAHQAVVEVTRIPTLTITFDKPVWDVAGKKVCLYRVDGAITEIVTTAGSVTGQGTNTIIVTLPEKTLTYEQSYFVFVEAGAFKDAAGNPLSVAYGGAAHWQFTTEPIWALGSPILGCEFNSGRLRPVVVINAFPKAREGFCVVTQNPLAPSSEQVKEGKDRDNVSLPLGYYPSGNVISSQLKLWLPDLNPESDYYVYVVLQDNNGVLTRPKQLILRASTEEEPLPSEAVALDKADLTWDVIRKDNTAENAVTGNLSLPIFGPRGTAISWTADPTGYVNTVTGAVTRPEHDQGDQIVTLTATISKEGGISQTKTFTTIIKAKPAPYVPQPEPQPEPQPTSVITSLAFTQADRLLDRSLIKSSKAQISLEALKGEKLSISTAVVKRLAEHKLPITVLADDVTVTVDSAALLLEQVKEWRKGKAWFEISITELVGEELEAVTEAWQLPVREGRCSVIGSIYQIAVRYWEDGQARGLDIPELLQEITIQQLLPEGLSEQELALLKVVLAEAEMGDDFKPIWLEALHDEETGLLSFATSKLGRFALACLEQPACVIDLTIEELTGYVNGVEHIMDVPPCLIDSRTLVPVRFVGEAMGAKVGWNASTQTVRIKFSGQVVELVIGQTDPAMGLDVPAQIVGNRTLVPLRFVSESLGALVRWLPATRSVEIVLY